jgi:glycosyltransferase involved in cell wall biosynthesis
MKLNSKDIWTVIPVYNHAATLTLLLEKILKISPNILIVDDGSTDFDSTELKEKYPIELIRHPQNQGKGSAIISAAEHLSKKDVKYFVTIDADGQHLPEDLNSLINLLLSEEENEKILIGSRIFDSSNIPWPSKIGRSISNFLIFMETGLRLKDTQSGLRAYPVKIFNQVNCYCRRFGFETEILVKAIKNGTKVREKDISVIYPEKQQRISHFRFFSDNLKILLLHFQLLTCFFIQNLNLNRGKKEYPGQNENLTEEASL